MIDEDPSPEDIERFGDDRDTGYCPSCGAEIWDEAELCPKCGQFITAPSHRRPHERRRRTTLIVIVVVVMLLAWIVFGSGRIL